MNQSANESETEPASELSLYIHIPFCIKKCPYCDFNSYAGLLDSSTESQYVEALLAELRYYASTYDFADHNLSSIFLGGGTPSLLCPSSIEKILQTAASFLNVNAATEITLEANPGSLLETLGARKLAGFRKAGINRISFGAQSFNSSKLKFLGRIHSPDDTIAVVRAAQDAGFTNINTDIIFGTAVDTPSILQNDLEQALALGTTHLSIYELTIEPQTEFAKLAKKKPLTIDECAALEQYAMINRITTQHSFARYEVSNYSLPGHRCQHNLGYWNGRCYLGIGAGAHGYIPKTIARAIKNADIKSTCKPAEICSNSLANASPLRSIRTENIKNPTRYIDSVTNSGHAIDKVEELTQEQEELEFLYLRLRTTNGINYTDYRARFGMSFTDRYQQYIDKLNSQNFFVLSDSGLYLNEQGFLQLNTVVEELAMAITYDD